MSKEKVPGVYLIVDQQEALTYAGSSVDLGRRLYDHKRKLELGTHPNWKLQRAFNKGHELTCIPIPLEAGVSTLEVEQAILNQCLDEGGMLNIARDVSAPTLGRTFGPETRQKVGEALRGKPRSEETREKIRQGHLGKPKDFSYEGRARLAQATGDRFRGKTLSEEHKQRLSLTLTGRTQSPEHYQKNMDKSRSEQTPVVCDGVPYLGVREASRALDISRGALHYRLKSPNFENWHYATPHETKETDHG
jgi:hypothetical protein